MTPNDDKPASLNARNIGLAALLALAIVAVAAAFLMGPAGASIIQDDSPSDCQAAAAWHYGEALKAGSNSEYHFWAGAAAEKLAATGGSCDGWDGA